LNGSIGGPTTLSIIMPFSITTLNIKQNATLSITGLDTECCYAVCHMTLTIETQ